MFVVLIPQLNCLTRKMQKSILTIYLILVVLTLITLNLSDNDFLDHGLHDDHHEHKSDITSVSIGLFQEPSTLKQFNHWLRMLLIMEGMDVFRAKGILNVKNSNNRYIFQSVYMLFEGRFR